MSKDGRRFLMVTDEQYKVEKAIPVDSIVEIGANSQTFSYIVYRKKDGVDTIFVNEAYADIMAGDYTVVL